MTIIIMAWTPAARPTAEPQTCGTMFTWGSIWSWWSMRLTLCDYVLQWSSWSMCSWWSQLIPANPPQMLRRWRRSSKTRTSLPMQRYQAEKGYDCNLMMNRSNHLWPKCSSHTWAMETQGPPGLAIRSRNPYLKSGHHDHQEPDHDDHQSWPPHEATLPPSDGNRCLCLHSLVTLRHKINYGWWW